MFLFSFINLKLAEHYTYVLLAYFKSYTAVFKNGCRQIVDCTGEAVTYHFTLKLLVLFTAEELTAVNIFAVYLDMLERLNESDNSFDVDTVILYNEDDDISVLNGAIRMLADNGKSVMAQKSVPNDLKYKQLLKLKDKGVVIIETNA